MAFYYRSRHIACLPLGHPCWRYGGDEKLVDELIQIKVAAGLCRKHPDLPDREEPLLDKISIYIYNLNTFWFAGSSREVSMRKLLRT